MKYLIRTPIQVAMPAHIRQTFSHFNHMGLVSIVQSSLLFYRDFVTNVTQEIDF